MNKLHRRLAYIVNIVAVAALVGVGLFYWLSLPVITLNNGSVSIALADDGGIYDSHFSPTYYLDENGDEQIIDNILEPAIAPWDWQMTKADYNVRVKDDITSGQVLEFSVDDSTLALQPMALEWTNDINQLQSLSMPQSVSPVVTNPVVPDNVLRHKGNIAWEDAYGSGIDFEWECTSIRLNKILTVSGLSDLPPPAQYIQNGGNPVLRLNLILNPSSDVGVYVNGGLWDKSSKQQTYDEIEFRKGGEVLWYFMPLMYWDSAGNEGQSVATLEKRGQSLYISIRVPYEWLQKAKYPVYIDADVTIEAAAFSNDYEVAGRGGPFWVSPTVGYVIYVDGSVDLVYRKTEDGGATWAAANVLQAGTIWSFDSYADWQTAGDAGTKIHIVCIDQDSDDIIYVSLDTSDDSEATDKIEDCQGTGQVITTRGRAYHQFSITKTRGGNIAVAFYYSDDAPAQHFGFYTSPDADTWTSSDDPFEEVVDYILLFPGNEADNQDVWAVFWDFSADEISLKTYDNSGNSWSAGTLISGSMAESTVYLQMDGAVRLSDGHLIFAAWTQYNNAAADLTFWDINGAASITQKTSIEPGVSGYFLCSVFINQVNDDIYAAYVGGTAAQSAVKCYYQKSIDGGANWSGSDQTMQADAEGDERWVSAGAVKATNGGKFQPFWFDDDLNDFFTNADNGISIAAAGGVVAPTVTTQATDDIEDTTATGHGTITATGGENATIHGIEWDIDSAAPYANDVHTHGDFSIGAFEDSLTELPTGITIYCRAYATNTEGTGYGDEVSFLTKPAAPTNVSATDGAHEDKVVITWTKSTGATDYHVFRGAVDLGAAGDVATFNDNGATAGTITDAGNVTASDGTSPLHVTLSLAGEATGTTSHTYKVVASNVTGDSNDSLTDNGYRGVGAITYQWQVDEGGGYGNIVGGTTDSYNYTGAPAPTVTPGNASASDGTSAAHVTLSLAGETGNNGTTYPYQCIVSASGASNSPQTSDNDNGYRGTDALTYQWQRSAADADAAYGNIGGATTDPYNDLGGVVEPDGRFYKCTVGMTGAAAQESTADRGYMSAGSSPVVVTNNAIVDGIEVTLNGNITNTGDPPGCDYRGFVWDTSTHADPGDTAPGASAYTNYATESGSYNTGAFDHLVEALTPLTTYYYRACAHNDIGWAYGGELTYFATEDGKIYLELRPDLDETLIRGQAGVPSDAAVGEFNGYSLLIIGADEELHYVLCVPDRWDGESDILIHIHSCLSLANQEGLSNRWQIEWEHYTGNEDIVPVTNNVVTLERLFYSNDQYQSYIDWMVINYDIDADDPIEPDDVIAITLRRVNAAEQAPDADEIIVFAIDILFARGDLLGAPGDIVTDGELCGLVGECTGIATTEDLGGYVTAAEMDNTATALRGFILLIPLIGFSILAYWKRHPVIYMITAGVALVTGLEVPDILTGTTTALSMSIGLLLVVYSFVCLALAINSLFRQRREYYVTEN